MAEARAVARFVRVPARKARLVADLIRGHDVNSALVQVQVAKRQAARVMEKVLRSAMANANFAAIIRRAEFAPLMASTNFAALVKNICIFAKFCHFEYLAFIFRPDMKHIANL